MPKKNPETVGKVEKRNGRTVSSATAWWLDHSPNGYRYYCVHGILLTAECDKKGCSS